MRSPGLRRMDLYLDAPHGFVAQGPGAYHIGMAGAYRIRTPH